MKINQLRETLEVQVVDNVIRLIRCDESTGQDLPCPFQLDIFGATELVKQLLDGIEKVAPHYGLNLSLPGFGDIAQAAVAEYYGRKVPVPRFGSFFDISDTEVDTLVDFVNAGDLGEDDGE